MSYPGVDHGPGPRHYANSTRLGGQALSHSQNQGAEQEYDRLRSLARQEHDKRSRCFDQAHQAYERGDGGAAHNLSEEGKRHGQMMEQYNQQASQFIFRENNAPGHVDSDTIDLHGQFVEEAEDILEERIKFARSQGQSHLHVIVGKGNHSPHHVQKIKPRVEQVCRDLGLQYTTEENAGRMYINLQGGPAAMPPSQAHHGPPHQPQQPQYHGGQQGGHQQQQQQHGGQQHNAGHQQQNQNAEIEKVVRKFLPRVIRKLEGCCVVM